MRNRLTALASIMLAACTGQGGTGAVPAADRIAELPVANAGFEEPAATGGVPGWALSQHAGVAAYDMRRDAGSAAAGKASFRIQRLQAQVFGSITQNIAVPADYAGKTLQLSAMTRTENVGSRGWKIFIDVPGRRATTVETGSADWHRASVRTVLPTGAHAVTIGAMLLDDGTAWLDDVHLSVVETH